MWHDLTAHIKKHHIWFADQSAMGLAWRIGFHRAQSPLEDNPNNLNWMLNYADTFENIHLTAYIRKYHAWWHRYLILPPELYRDENVPLKRWNHVLSIVWSLNPLLASRGLIIGATLRTGSGSGLERGGKRDCQVLPLQHPFQRGPWQHSISHAHARARL